MRVKEEAEDYRYFREPDLVDLAPSDEWQAAVRAGLGPMPAERRAALAARLDSPSEAQLETVAVVIDLGLDAWANAAIEAGIEPGVALARTANELAGVESLDAARIPGFVATLLMESRGELSATQTKTVLADVLASGADPKVVAAAKGFEQLAADELGDIVARLIEENPAEWSRYKEGDDKLAQFFIGLVMKATRGQANGKAVVAELQSRR